MERTKGKKLSKLNLEDKRLDESETLYKSLMKNDALILPKPILYFLSLIGSI